MSLQQGYILSASVPQKKRVIEFSLDLFEYLFPVVENEKNYYAAAQNCHHKPNGAYTGEVSAEMLHSIAVPYCIVGHSERRQYFSESNQVLAEKINCCLENFIKPIFCCGEPLEIREAGTQNDFVAQQLKESLFHLTAKQLTEVIIAYEPIWSLFTITRNGKKLSKTWLVLEITI